MAWNFRAQSPHNSQLHIANLGKVPRGLAAHAAELLNEHPFSATVIIFHAKCADQINFMPWDQSGLVLMIAERDTTMTERDELGA